MRHTARVRLWLLVIALITVQLSCVMPGCSNMSSSVFQVIQKELCALQTGRGRVALVEVLGTQWSLQRRSRIRCKPILCTLRCLEVCMGLMWQITLEFLVRTFTFLLVLQ